MIRKLSIVLIALISVALAGCSMKNIPVIEIDNHKDAVQIEDINTIHMMQFTVDHKEKFLMSTEGIIQAGDNKGLYGGADIFTDTPLFVDKSMISKPSAELMEIADGKVKVGAIYTLRGYMLMVLNMEEQQIQDKISTLKTYADLSALYMDTKFLPADKRFAIPKSESK